MIRAIAHRTRAARIGLLLVACACKPASSTTPTTTPTTPTPATAPTTPQSLHGPVVSIELTGTTREPEVQSALTTSIGAAYDATAVARDVRALWRLRGISDVQVDARQTANGVALRYRIVELPRIRKIEIQGGQALYTTTTRIHSADLKDVPQDPRILKQLAEELRMELNSHAFLDATVDTRLVDTGDGRVDVVLTVTEGPKVTLAALTLRGNTKLKTPELEALCRKHGLAVGQPVTPAATQAALLAVIARYHDIGHIHAELGPTSETRSADRTTLTASYEFREGAAYRLGKLVFRGALVAPLRDYEKRLGARPGQPFNTSQLARGIDEIRALHRQRNAGEPNITPMTTIDEKTKKVDLTLEIAKP